MKGLKIKVCGMREPENIRTVAALLPDYLGFIFYPDSKRCAGDMPTGIRAEIPAFVKKVGVFVDEKEDRLMKTCSDYGIGTVQLHGDESPEYCEKLSESGLKIIKVMRIGTTFDTADLLPYRDACSYFLFDTQTEAYGGSGEQFRWALLKAYTLEIPFFLSGGVDPGDVDRIKHIAHPMLFGVDINSRFETAPGIKDAEAVDNFITAIRTPR
jgi:phosphoribosylanthranilate isomerase